jgi:uncharacterized protein YdeI (YjbR/CyaY-like superfamily)
MRCDIPGPACPPTSIVHPGDDARVPHAHSFATPSDFGDWLSGHHARETEIWLKIYKKASGVASVTWADAILEAIAWGWIDGVKRANDEISWLQRFTPRSAMSRWSKINRGHAERLIIEGKMQDAGLKAIAAAKADGRWVAAYAGSAGMEFPAAVLSEIASNQLAQATFDSLSRADLYQVFYRLQNARKEETRQTLIKKMLERLSRGERPS